MQAGRQTGRQADQADTANCDKERCKKKRRRQAGRRVGRYEIELCAKR
jgi:hypothetical protein